jgi:hypothetical protein
MKKRLQIDLFLDEISAEDLATLKNIIAKKSADIDNKIKTVATMHDCGHDEGKPCSNLVNL